MEQQSITTIDNYLKSVSYELLEQELKKLQNDKRIGIVNLIKKYERKIKKHTDLIEKYTEMNFYEREAYSKSAKYIGGIDEVGRGPLAGPVVSAVVILHPDDIILGLDDSKKLSKKKREELYNIIIDKAVDYSIGIESPEIIDSINILNATYKSMSKAVGNLKIKPDYLLVDAVTIPDLLITQKPIIKGDSKSVSIAAASIIAKVTRDSMMEKFHELYPEYGFIKNMGYGTSDHINAIKKYGLSPIHRITFTKNFTK